MVVGSSGFTMPDDLDVTESTTSPAPDEISYASTTARSTTTATTTSATPDNGPPVDGGGIPCVN